MVQVLNEKKRKLNFTENAMRNTDLQTNTMISFERNEFIRKTTPWKRFASGDFIGLG